MAVLLVSCGPQKIKTELPVVPEVERPPCDDDPREDDDTLFAVAGTEKSVTGQRFVKIEGVSCPGDDDWIHAYRACCGDVAVEVTWTASEGELRVDLVGADGQPFPTDGAESAPGKIKVRRANHEQDFFARIRNRSGERMKYTATVRFNDE